MQASFREYPRIGKATTAGRRTIQRSFRPGKRQRQDPACRYLQLTYSGTGTLPEKTHTLVLLRTLGSREESKGRWGLGAGLWDETT